MNKSHESVNYELNMDEINLFPEWKISLKIKVCWTHGIKIIIVYVSSHVSRHVFGWECENTSTYCWSWFWLWRTRLEISSGLGARRGRHIIGHRKPVFAGRQIRSDVACTALSWPAETYYCWKAMRTTSTTRWWCSPSKHRNCSGLQQTAWARAEAGTMSEQNEHSLEFWTWSSWRLYSAHSAVAFLHTPCLAVYWKVHAEDRRGLKWNWCQWG